MKRLTFTILLVLCNALSSIAAEQTANDSLLQQLLQQADSLHRQLPPLAERIANQPLARNLTGVETPANTEQVALQTSVTKGEEQTNLLVNAFVLTGHSAGEFDQYRQVKSGLRKIQLNITCPSNVKFVKNGTYELKWNPNQYHKWDKHWDSYYEVGPWPEHAPSEQWLEEQQQKLFAADSIVNAEIKEKSDNAVSYTLTVKQVKGKFYPPAVGVVASHKLWSLTFSGNLNAGYNIDSVRTEAGLKLQVARDLVWSPWDLKLDPNLSLSLDSSPYSFKSGKLDKPSGKLTALLNIAKLTSGKLSLSYKVEEKDQSVSCGFSYQFMKGK